MRLNRFRIVPGLACIATVIMVTAQARAAIIISEVDPNGSAATYGADWFELTNTGASAVDITGWKMDDNSNLFANAVAFRGLTSIAAGKSVVFLEGNATGTTDATLDTAFTSFWFGSTVPAGFTIANYGGSAVGLSATADGVNVFDASGNVVAAVAFGATSLGTTLDNAAGNTATSAPGPTISTNSAVGANGAFASNGTPAEVGSPGVVPEPSTFVLAGLGIMGLLGYKMRRNTKS